MHNSQATPSGAAGRRLSSLVLGLLALALPGCSSWLNVGAEAPAAEKPRSAAPVPPVAEETRPAAPMPTEMSEFVQALWHDPAFQRQVAESYMSDGDYEPPRPTGERGTEMLLEIQAVQKLQSEDKLDEALARLEKDRGEEAYKALFDFYAGNIYFQKERLAEAAAAYQAAVVKHSKFRRAWRMLAVTCIRQGNLAKAVPALTRVIVLGDADATIYGLLGFAYGGTGDNLAAESAFRQAILLDPGTLDWKMGLLRSLSRQERFADVVALCSRLIADQPERTDLWLIQASAYVGLSEPLKAAENYELLDHLGQANAGNLNTLGDIYVNNNAFDLAVGAYIRAMAKDPQGRPDRALLAAKVLSSRGATQETRRLLDRIDAQYGQTLEAADRKDLLKLRARLAGGDGAGAEEARLLEEVVALDPLDGEALILLGQYYGRDGNPNKNPDKAIFYFERAESLEKYEADAKVRHAQLLVKQTKYAEALPLLRSAQQLKPRESVQQYLDQIERLTKGR